MAKTNLSKPKSWRDVLRVHPAAELFPPMSTDELKVLGEDIKTNGLREGVSMFDGAVLDGRNRLDGMELVGLKLVTGNGQIEWAAVRCRDIGRVDPVAFVISKNIHRRHLTAEQKRELIAKLVKATLAKSDRQIAEQIKASPSTVGRVRKELEQTGDVSTLDTRSDSKGRRQPAHKPPTRDDPAVIAAADRAEARAHKANAEHVPNITDQRETPRADDLIAEFVSDFEARFTDAMRRLDAAECAQLIAALREEIDGFEMRVTAASREMTVATASRIAQVGVPDSVRRAAS